MHARATSGIHRPQWSIDANALAAVVGYESEKADSASG
jgi:hypothetical protein